MHLRLTLHSASSVVCVGLSLLLTPVLSADNWPQWRGPSSNGVSAEKELPSDWSTTENVAWKAPIAGLGTSSPVVWGDTIFVTSQIGNAPVSGGESHPVLARADRALAVREHAIGGRRGASEGREVFLVVEAFRRTDGARLWEYRLEATGDLPESH